MDGPSRGERGRQVPDVNAAAKLFELIASPVWLYDSNFCCNVWGNSAALKLFGTDEASFKACQLEQLGSGNPHQLRSWKNLNARIRQDVEVDRKELTLKVSHIEPVPGFVTCGRQILLLSAYYRPISVLLDGSDKVVTLIQVLYTPGANDVESNHLRMVEMCDNHPMFQFLFEETGKLLAANKRALENMREHLGSDAKLTLQMYLSIGECDGSVAPDDMYAEAMEAIFKQQKPCHRFPQLRWSKRHPGKFRWVLYEMWPLKDPISGKQAVLVTEQNISQVKALEEQFRKQNERLEAQLEEALVQREHGHKPTIDIDTPADKTLKLLDKIMRGLEVSPKEAMELRDAIWHAGDLLQPVNFNEQLMNNSQTVLDSEVSQSLIQLLSTRKPAQLGSDTGAMSSSVRAEVQSPVNESKSPVTAEAVRTLLALTKNPSDQLMEVLSKLNDWQFDAFKLDAVAHGRPLSMLGFALLKRYEIIEKFQFSEAKLANFLMRIEDGYPSNPYHNRIHAADVLQSLHVLIKRGGLIQSGYCDEIALLSCYLSAIIHDFEHKGVNNDFLVRVSDTLAVLYNDKSPMENHHLAASFQLMNTDEYNFLPKMPHKAKEIMRKQIIDMVLATDMKQHFAIHSMFQQKMQLNGTRGSGSDCRSHSTKGSPHSTAQDQHKVVDEDQKSLVLQVALKCADLGHLASPRAVHKHWVQYLEEEFFRQGDKEKEIGLSVSPLMDREKNGITKSQVGFFDIVALPLFQSFSQAFADASPMLEAVKDNYAMWREEAALYSSARNS